MTYVLTAKRLRSGVLVSCHYARHYLIPVVEKLKAKFEQDPFRKVCLSYITRVLEKLDVEEC